MSSITITQDATVVITQDPDDQFQIVQDPASVAIVQEAVTPLAYSQLTGLPALGTASALNAGTGAGNVPVLDGSGHVPMGDLNVGTGANQLVELDGSSRLPAVDGSQLINVDPRDQGCGRLIFTSSTQITFVPFNGSTIMVNGLLQSIPALGVFATNGSLSASTLYYVYAFMSGASLTLELSTTGHVTSSTAGNVGTEIKSGDDTRTLIGMVRTTVSSTFNDAPQQRFVASWFNRKQLEGLYFSGTPSGFNLPGANAEITTNARLEFVAWADQFVDVEWYVGYSTASAGIQATLVSDLDGSSMSGVSMIFNGDGSSRVLPSAIGASTAVTEGYHYVTLFAASTGTFTVNQLTSKSKVM